MYRGGVGLSYLLNAKVSIDIMMIYQYAWGKTSFKNNTYPSSEDLSSHNIIYRTGVTLYLYKQKAL